MMRRDGWEYPVLTERCQCGACYFVTHASSCAVHNAPALPAGPCDCNANDDRPPPEPFYFLTAVLVAWWIIVDVATIVRAWLS
jgi:hypothetical protein